MYSCTAQNLCNMYEFFIISFPFSGHHTWPDEKRGPATYGGFASFGYDDDKNKLPGKNYRLLDKRSQILQDGSGEATEYDDGGDKITSSQ